MTHRPHSNRSTPIDATFSQCVLEVVDAIPPGLVMTYGGVAAALGSRGARAVGHVMAHHGSAVAWWRVIQATGAPPHGLEERALAHYHEEGTPLQPTGDTYRVNLARALHRV